MSVFPDCNFIFLEESYPHLAQNACIAETCLYTDPHNSIIKIGLLNEELCRIISVKSDIKLPKPYAFRKVVNNLKKHFFTDEDAETCLKIEEIAKSRNMAAHNLPRSAEAWERYMLVAANTLIAGYSISINFYRHFIDPDYCFPEFRMPPRLEKPASEGRLEQGAGDGEDQGGKGTAQSHDEMKQAEGGIEEGAREGFHVVKECRYREEDKGGVKDRYLAGTVLGGMIGGLPILGRVVCACIMGATAVGSAMGAAASAKAAARIAASVAGATALASAAGKAAGIIPPSVNNFFRSLEF